MRRLYVQIYVTFLGILSTTTKVLMNDGMLVVCNQSTYHH
jgi:hypothetical protein